MIIADDHPSAAVILFLFQVPQSGIDDCLGNRQRLEPDSTYKVCYTVILHRYKLGDLLDIAYLQT
jgi:hypothetical protein